MFTQRLVVRCATVFLSLLLTAVFVSAQSKKTAPARQPGQTPADQARKVKTEPNNAYVRWEREDVSLIITPEESRAFEKLTTDEEREEFIKIFWRQRDPDPDTEENEYREQFYERLAYANEHFSSGVPGWKTDRGRSTSSLANPTKSKHTRQVVHISRSHTKVPGRSPFPFETWFYRYIPGVGSGIEIEFVDPSGSGEYRIARDANEKKALAHVPGPDQASVDSPNGYLRERDSPFGRIEQLRNLEEAPPVARRNPNDGVTGTPKTDDNPLDFSIRADFFKLSDNRVLAMFTVQTENRDLVFQDSGGLQTARLNIFGKIFTVTERRIGAFEDSVTTTATVAELTEAKERRSAYSKVIILAPGRYRADLNVRDVGSGATGVRQYAFEVPRYEDDKLATSSMILAAKLENMAGKPPGGQFVIGETKVVPNLTGLYHRGQSVGVYLQVYNAGIDQTTLRPAVDVEYALLKDGKEVGKQAEDWRGISDSGQRLTLARLLDTKALAPGDYEVAIRIHDQVSGQALAQAARFTVVP